MNFCLDYCYTFYLSKKKKKHNVMNFSLANKIHSLYQIDHEIGMGLWEPCA